LGATDLVARYLVMNQVWGTLCRLPMGRGAHTPNNTPGPSDLQWVLPNVQSGSQVSVHCTFWCAAGDNKFAMRLSF
jgi:hypothetical protein